MPVCYTSIAVVTVAAEARGGVGRPPRVMSVRRSSASMWRVCYMLVRVAVAMGAAEVRGGVRRPPRVMSVRRSSASM